MGLIPLRLTPILIICSRIGTVGYVEKKKIRKFNIYLKKGSKLTRKKYKTRHNSVGKPIHSELCKIQINPDDNCYMHKSEFNLEKKTYKIHRNFEI